MISVNVAKVLEMKEFLNRINRLDIEAVQFIDENGVEFYVSNEAREQHTFSGLTIVDFITMNFYKSP